MRHDRGAMPCCVQGRLRKGHDKVQPLLRRKVKGIWILGTKLASRQGQFVADDVPAAVVQGVPPRIDEGDEIDGHPLGNSSGLSRFDRLFGSAVPREDRFLIAGRFDRLSRRQRRRPRAGADPSLGGKTGCSRGRCPWAEPDPSPWTEAGSVGGLSNSKDPPELLVVIPFTRSPPRPPGSSCRQKK